MGSAGSGYGTKGDQHGAVDGTSVVQQCAYHLLQPQLFGRGEIGRLVDGCGKLWCGGIGGGSEFVGGILGFLGGGMLDAMECFGDVTRHGELHGAIDVVPIEGETTVFGSCPIGGDGVLGLEAVQEMLGMLPTHVFDTEVVHDQAKDDRAGVMAKQARSVRTGGVAPCCQMLLKAGVGDDACLRYSIHALPNFDQDTVMMKEGG
jgi:hypothetical protein